MNQLLQKDIYFKKLVGEKIYLSPRSIEDAEIFTEWMNDFEVTDYTGRSGTLISFEGEKKYLEENYNPEATFSIVTLDDDKLIGKVGLEKINL
jgi:RimJ/RimL family protein N-acetyltransferase